MSLLRIPFIITTTLAFNNTVTNPNPPVSKDERAKYRSTPMVLIAMGSLKLAVLAGGLLEAAVITASHLPSQPLAKKILSSLVLKPAWSINAIRVTPALLAGWFVAVAGSYVRYRCFTALGALFTFELSIRKEHKLVTSGPYAYVRHPSYTSGFTAAFGTCLCFFGSGSWMRECGWLENLRGKIAMGAPVGLLCVLLLVAVRRTTVEDRTLQQEFGAEWDEWAKRVPYKMIPYIF